MSVSQYRIIALINIALDFSHGMDALRASILQATTLEEAKSAATSSTQHFHAPESELRTTLAIEARHFAQNQIRNQYSAQRMARLRAARKGAPFSPNWQPHAGVLNVPRHITTRNYTLTPESPLGSHSTEPHSELFQPSQKEPFSAEKQSKYELAKALRDTLTEAELAQYLSLKQDIASAELDHYQLPQEKYTERAKFESRIEEALKAVSSHSRPRRLEADIEVPQIDLDHMFDAPPDESPMK